MNKISFVRYSPYTYKRSLTTQVVECYRKVFADKPWNEWLKCPKCGQYWGIKDRELLQSRGFRHCNTDLVDFWPKKQVTDDLYHEIVDNTSCWLATINNKVVGFCWGYPITPLDLEKKLGISIDHGLVGHLPIAYQDEVGVLLEYRGLKIAKSMVKHRLQDFLNQGLNVGVVRTRKNPEPSVTFSWYMKLGYQILASYPNNDGRVILGRKLDGLLELL